MVEYVCEFCNYKTSNKNNYKKHESTKKHEKNSLKYDDKKLQNATNSIQKVSKSIILQQNSIQKVSFDATKSQNIVYECDYCDACFKHINNKYRHQKSNCKAKRREEEIIREKDRQIEGLMSMLSESINKCGNTVNNNNNSNNCITNNTLNITINGYGKEDLSYLTNEDWHKILNIPENGIVKLFIETHFNPKKPENQNIRQRNRNSKYLEVHDGKEWKHIHKKKVLSDVADDKRDMIEEKYDDLQDDIEDCVKEKHGEYYDNTYYDEKRNLLEQLEATILDKS